MARKKRDLLRKGLSSRIMFYLYFHPQSGRSVAKEIYQRDYPPTDKVLNNIKKLIKLEFVYRVGEKRESKCHVESTGLINIINEQLKEITDELTDIEAFMLIKVISSKYLRNLVEEFVGFSKKEIFQKKEIDFLGTIYFILAYASAVWLELRRWGMIADVEEMMYEEDNIKEKESFKYIGRWFDELDSDDSKAEELSKTLEIPFSYTNLHEVVQTTLKEISENKLSDQEELYEDEKRALKLAARIILYPGFYELPDRLMIKLSKIDNPTKLRPYRIAMIMMNESIRRNLADYSRHKT